MQNILETITKPVKLSLAPIAVIREVQKILKVTSDGIVGAKTLTAFAQFKAKHYLGQPDILGVTTAEKLLGQILTLITEDKLESIFGHPVTVAQLNDLNNCLTKFEINTTERLRHFLSQIAHESGGGIYTRELASGSAYEGRKDLGNTQPGFGKKYKGAGYIQLTGYYNYKKLSDYLKDPRVMEGVNYVAVQYPATSAGFWWMVNKINDYIDKGTTVEQISAKVNGRHPANGLADRIMYYKRACKVIN